MAHKARARFPFGVRNTRTLEVVSAHTSIWPAKIRIRELGEEEHEIVVAQRGVWVRPEDADLYK